MTGPTKQNRREQEGPIKETGSCGTKCSRELKKAKDPELSSGSGN